MCVYIVWFFSFIQQWNLNYYIPVVLGSVAVGCKCRPNAPVPLNKKGLCGGLHQNDHTAHLPQAAAEVTPASLSLDTSSTRLASSLLCAHQTHSPLSHFHQHLAAPPLTVKCTVGQRWVVSIMVTCLWRLWAAGNITRSGGTGNSLQCDLWEGNETETSSMWKPLFGGFWGNMEGIKWFIISLTHTATYTTQA